MLGNRARSLVRGGPWALGEALGEHLELILELLGISWAVSSRFVASLGAFLGALWGPPGPF